MEKTKEYLYFSVSEIFIKISGKCKRKFAKCICNCGTEFICREDSLNKRKGCKKCGCTYGGKKRVLDGFMAAKKTFYNSYLNNAIKRNLPFELSMEQFSKIISLNCYYCGMTPQDQSYLSKSTKKYGKFYASGIDRLDNNLGYNLDNCVPCCTTCNMMKKTMHVDKFLDHVLSIVEYQKHNVQNSLNYFKEINF